MSDPKQILEKQFWRPLASSDAKLSFSLFPALHLPLRRANLEASKLLEVGKTPQQWKYMLDHSSEPFLEVHNSNIDVLL